MYLFHNDSIENRDRRIYLDHAATSPLLPEAREAMLPWLDAGNPSSLHADGRKAKLAIDEAREIVSEAVGSLFAETLFTSGGTEGANLALVGAALANRDERRRRVLVSSAEHHCVLHTKDAIEKLGYSFETIPVDRNARVDHSALEQMLDERVLIVSTMHANNELGSYNEIGSIAERTRAVGALLHGDAVQTLGPSLVGDTPKLAQIGADIVTVSAHKIGGPKGIGAITIRAGVKLKPLIAGGGQEREMRGGTENVAAIRGFAAAIAGHRPTDLRLREEFLSRLEGAGFVPTVLDRSLVLPGHAHVRLPGVDAETMLIRLDRAGVSASSGSACSSGSVEPSHVLLACGYSEKESKEGLRFTFGPENSLEDAIEVAERVSEAAGAVLSQRR